MRPNFFLLLELDPDNPWNDALFEARLREKRNDWSRRAGGINAQQKLDAQRNLQSVGDIRSVMTDPDKREEEARDARAQRAQQRADDAAALDTLISRASEKGRIFEREIAAWLAREPFKGRFTEADVRARIRVPIERDEAAAAPRMDPARAKTIRDRLAAIRMPNLYGFLGMAQTAATADLHARADALYVELTRRAKDAETTARMEVAGLALDVFSSEAKRQEYDAELGRETLDALVRTYEEVCVPAGSVAAAQVGRFLEEARDDGLDPDEALAALKRMATQRKLTFYVNERDAQRAREAVQCPACLTFNVPEARTCRRCGFMLKLDCPNCDQTDLAYDTKACPKCGFPIDDRAYMSDRVAECERQVAAGSWRRAIDLFHEVEHAWDPRRPDEIKRRIEALRGRIEAHEAQEHDRREKEAAVRDAAAKRVNEAIGEHWFLQAERALQDLPSDDVRYAGLQARIERELGPLREKMRQAEHEAATAPEAAARACLEILEACQDFVVAGELLRTLRPGPPTDCHAEAAQDAVRVRWSASPSVGITYVVMRKEKAKPLSEDDGERVVEHHKTTTYADRKPPVGVSLYYVVYAMRQETASEACPASEVVLVAPNVSDLVKRVGDRQVEMTWRTPPHARVVVTRTEGMPPERPVAGTPVRLTDPSHLTARDLRNGVTYHYSLVCEYTDEKGQTVRSPGIVESVIPQVPPEFPKPLVIARTRGSMGIDTAELEWTSDDSKGTPIVLRSQERPPFRFGQIVPEPDFERRGSILRVAGKRASDPYYAPDERYYSPAVFFQGMAYCGDPQLHNSLVDVTDLRATGVPTGIRLDWAWPGGVDEVRVVYQRGGLPGRPLEVEQQLTVKRERNQQRGGCEIAAEMGADMHIAVINVAQVGARTIVSAGARVVARARALAQIRFAVERVGLPSRPVLVLELKAGDPITLPRMEVRAKQGTIPVSRTDGDHLMEIPAGTHLQRRCELALGRKEKGFKGETYAMVFPTDDRDYGTLTILPPTRPEVRLH